MELTKEHAATLMKLLGNVSIEKVLESNAMEAVFALATAATRKGTNVHITTRPGSKIPAIKMIRTILDTELREAKDIIEDLDPQDGGGTFFVGNVPDDRIGFVRNHALMYSTPNVSVSYS